MPFRGYFALNQVEFANSSRVVAHLGHDVPTTDDAVFGSPDDCSLTEYSTLLYSLPTAAIAAAPLLYYPPNGSRRFGPGLYEVGDCWDSAAVCAGCSLRVLYDDTWTGLADFLGDTTYRPELAPWYVSELPESGEFGGVWIMDAAGFDSTPVERTLTPTVGPGSVAGPHRDIARTLIFDALLVGCTNAGVDYGLKWLTCLLRDTCDTTDTRLRYLTAHPGLSSADPTSMVRELRGVVLTRAPEVKETFVSGAGTNRQGNIYRVTWEMASLNPYAYMPSVGIDVDWDVITRQPINWIHAADCHRPETCEPMPILFSTECVPEEIEVVNTPPPVCGGCMPVGGIDKYSFMVPTQEYAFRCRETAVGIVISNTGETPLTLQAFWRICGTDVRCEDNQWPLQVAGLPAAADLYLDGITGRYWAWYDGLKRRPVGIVGTPNGAPWRPPVIDRQTCWEFVVQTASSSEFTASLVLSDREP